MRLVWLALVAASVVADAAVTRCEKIDGDCPRCRRPWIAGVNPVAEVHLSGESALVASAARADAEIKAMDGNAGNIQRFDDPRTGLHTSLFYFCCHSSEEVNRMKAALRSMEWTSFDVHYDDFSCNLDHDNQTVYLHALPSNQTLLFLWAKTVERALASHNITCNHPRKSKFHMTLARVDPAYPVDLAVARLSGTNFGSHRLCSFVFEGEDFYAQDCKR
eukprot:g1670.t1